MNRARLVKRLVVASGGLGTLALGTLVGYPEYCAYRNRISGWPIKPSISAEEQTHLSKTVLPSRAEQKKTLRTVEYDVLVVGGGATGCGVALDSVTRGLQTALVEKYDFSSGTSSRSTKLIHGGVRYLQKAIMKLDKEQYNMVQEALNERANLLDIAPHLSCALPIMLPVYKWWQLPYFWAGIKLYDVVAGRKVLVPSYLLSKTRALELFPMLQKDSLVGAIVYYDGQHNDARMCLSIGLTAARMGASIINHTEVTQLLKTNDQDGKERVCGARVRDRFTKEEYEIRAKCVVNATGPYTDTMRTMANQETKKICAPSSGVHVVLPDYYSPVNMGLLDPATKDGRVIFFLPWENNTIAGTTDRPCDVTDFPQPSEGEIEFILSEIKHYLSPDVQVRRGDVLSAWSGIRPLVRDPNKTDTQSIARNHIIEVSDNKLITIAGGKWTTYRSMAEETMDQAISVCGLEPVRGCQTLGLTLEGGHTWTPTTFIRLIQDYGLDTEVAQHLARTYGDKSVNVAKLGSLTGHQWPITGKLIHPSFPYIEAEVIYACKEYAATVTDIIARRTRLAFLNANATAECLPRIVELMATELGWDKKRKEEEIYRGRLFLQREMGLDLKAESQNVPINFTKDQINSYVARFKELDSGSKGFITVSDLRHYFEKNGEILTEDQLHDILNEVDLNRNGKVELGEFLQVLTLLMEEDPSLMSAKQYGHVSSTRFPFASPNKPISIARSGGGV